MSTFTLVCNVIYFLLGFVAVLLCRRAYGDCKTLLGAVVLAVTIFFLWPLVALMFWGPDSNDNDKDWPV